MVEARTIHLLGSPRNYLLRRNAASRSVRVRVVGGVMEVTVPRRISISEVERVLKDHAQSLCSQLNELEQREALIGAALADGELVVLFRGQWRPLVVMPGKRASLKDQGSRLVLTTGVGDPFAALERCLARAAALDIEACVGAMATEMGRAPRRVFVRDQRTKWGVCSAQGNVGFNWRLVLAPPEVLRYVVVHELAHLWVMGHSADFWAIVEKHFPDHKAARAYLRKNASRLHDRGYLADGRVASQVSLSSP